MSVITSYMEDCKKELYRQYPNGVFKLTDVGFSFQYGEWIDFYDRGGKLTSHLKN